MSSKKIKNVLDVLERLKKGAGYPTDASLARALGVGNSRISMWKKRGVIDLLLLSQKFEGLNIDWLLTGEGKMFGEKRSSKQKNSIIQLPGHAKLTELEEESRQYSPAVTGTGRYKPIMAIGSKMTPENIQDGDIIYIDTEMTPQEGDYVLRKAEDAPEIARYKTGDPQPIGVIIKLIRNFPATDRQ